MRKFFKVVMPVIISVLPTILQANVKLPEIFTSQMVLQRNVKLPVWGTASAGEKITVRINGQEQTVTADSAGNWKLELAPMKAGGPFNMEVKGANTITLDDILVGEVWLCSGQSNMEWRLKQSDNAKKEVANAKYPQIRLFQVRKSWNIIPKTKTLGGSWKSCSPENASNFSAAGYFFGRELYKKLNVPIGLINSSWGGTKIEPWTPPVGFKMTPALKTIYQQVDSRIPGSDLNRKLTEEAIRNYSDWIRKAQTALKDKNPIPRPKDYPANLIPYTNNHNPSVMYNSMIYPFVPFAIKGAIWYQGEANLKDGMLYFEKMKALINGWRTVWNNKTMPFYFVQLAPYQYGKSPFDILPKIWAAQTRTSLVVPNTGMAVINDIGNLRTIHPTNKQEVGRRLALLALNQTYGHKDLVCKSPVFKEMKIENNAVKVIFNNAKALKTRDGKAPTWFELCGENGVFHKANARIDGNTVIVTADNVSNPCVVRFAWNKIAVPNLTNEAGLPAASFKVGELPVCQKLKALIPETRDFKIVYAVDPSKSVISKDKRNITYMVDHSGEVSGLVTKIGYALILNDKDYVFVSMDPFTESLKEMGVPVKATGVRFQQRIANMTVVSNVNGVKNGIFARGNIEFWNCNYNQQNYKRVPGASDRTFDFGDATLHWISPGYGSMQVHNYLEKQTVFAYNNFAAGPGCDLGIGNCPHGNPDWTFAKNAGKYKSAMLYILIKTQ